MAFTVKQHKVCDNSVAGLYRIFLFAGLLFGITFCGVPQAPVANGSAEVFKTSAPSRLFFKNIRSAAYHINRQAGEPDVYTLRAYTGNPDAVMLIARIADHWRHDEAYIMISPGHLSEVSDTIAVRWNLPDSSGYITMAQADLHQQYNFAVQVYDKLLSSASMEMALSDGTYTPLFGSAKERVALMTTIRDYFRLTDVSTGKLY